MAKILALLVVGMALLAGCQQPGMTVGSLPPPRFDPPQLVPQSQAPIVKNTQPQVVRPPVLPPPTAAVPRDWVPSVPLGDWKYIVIHHSATAMGGLVKFDREHRAKGWDECGYHFVIGNGTESGDGAIEVGPRWVKQKHGAHTRTPDNRFNEHGIGICLVGNFDITNPTPNQMRSLTRLTAYLMRTYHIPASCVYGHRDCKPTDCPGRNMSIALVKQMVSQYAAQDAADMTAAAHAGK